MTLLELLELLRKHLRLVLLLPIACALVTGVYCYVFMADEYTATTSMYVLAQQQDQSNNLYSDLNASQMLTNDVAKLLKSDRIVEQVGQDVGIQGLRGYDVNVTSETTSRVITLQVTGPDAQTCADIANDMVRDVSQVAQDVMKVESVNPIDSAAAPTTPSGPRRLLYVAVALLAGLFVAIVVVVVSDMLNTKVRGQEDVEELLGIPVLGRIPVVKGGR